MNAVFVWVTTGIGGGRYHPRLSPGRSPCISTPTVGLTPRPRLSVEDKKVIKLLHRIPPAAHVECVLHHYCLRGEKAVASALY